MAVLLGAIKDSDIYYGKSYNGAWNLEGRDKNGNLVKMQYQGYTLAEAKKKFKKLFK